MSKIRDFPSAVKLATVYRCFRCSRSFKAPYGQPVEGIQFYTLEPPPPPPMASTLQVVGGALCSGCVMKAGEFLKLDATVASPGEAPDA